MKIFDVRHGNGGDKNRYCGPSAISAVTGMTTGEAARLIRHVTRKRSVKGTSTGAVRRALALCGIEAVRSPIPTRVENYRAKNGEIETRGVETLTTWLKRMVPYRTTGRVYLVVAGNHWQLISGRRYVCGISGEVVSVTDKKVKRRARVTEVYELVAQRGITIPKEAKPSPTDIAIRRSSARIASDFRAFMRKHKLDYRIYPECGLKYIDIQPTKLWPDGLETLHYNYDETKGRIEACLADPSLVIDGYYSE